MLHPEGNLDHPKDARPSLQQEAEFWEAEEGRNLLGDTFSIRNLSAYLPKCPAICAPDPDGWRGREHVLPLFLNDDTDAQERIIKHLILPYAIGDFHPSYLHEHAQPHQQLQSMAQRRRAPHQRVSQERSCRVLH